MHDNLDEHEQKAVDNIEEYGCHVMHIFAEGNLPRFTYSVGIYGKTNQPELIVMGLKREVAHMIVNDYNDPVKEGKVFEAGKYYSDFLEGYDVTFIEVAKEHYDEHFGWDIWYYGGKSFPVLQLVFPDKSGVWPWEDNASEDFKWYQPILSACEQTAHAVGPKKINKIEPDNLGVYVCPHVFEDTRPILYVGRSDGDWQFLCGGDDHDDQCHLVGVGHLTQRDPTLDELAELMPDWEAEREGVGTEWQYSKSDPE